MDGDPCPSLPAELVVHVVLLIQEHLQDEAVGRTGHRHLAHLALFLGPQPTSVLAAGELKVKQFP